METLSDATAQALSLSGREVLEQPKRFVAHVTDVIDTESPEARILYSACDEELLAYFAKALDTGTAEALLDTAERAARYLNETYVIDLDASRRVCFQIANGVATAAHVAGWREALMARNAASQSQAASTTSASASAQPAQTAVGRSPATESRRPAASDRPSVPQQPQATSTPSQKKSSSGMGVLFALFAAMMLLLAAVSMSPSADRDAQTPSELLATTEEDTSYLVSEGEVDGVGFWIEPRTDTFGGSQTKGHYLFLYNNNSYTVSVTLSPLSDTIRALGPGDNGAIWCLDHDAIDPEKLHVKKTDETSVAAYLSWTEQERSDGNLIIGVYNSSGTIQPLIKTLFLGPEYCAATGWMNSEEKDITTIEESYATYSYSDYALEPVFDGDYNIYVDGVMIPKH